MEILAKGLAIRLSMVIEEKLKEKYPRLYPKKSGDPKPIMVEMPNAQGTHVGAFRDNGASGYLYVLDSASREILGACWIYNRGKSPIVSEPITEENWATGPHLPNMYKNRSFAPPKFTLGGSNVAIVWNAQGTVVRMTYGGDAWGMLVLDWGRWRSYSYMLEEACPWGEPLTNDVRARYSID